MCVLMTENSSILEIIDYTNFPLSSEVACKLLLSIDIAVSDGSIKCHSTLHGDDRVSFIDFSIYLTDQDKYDMIVFNIT